MNRTTLFPVGHGMGKLFPTTNRLNFFRGQFDGIYKMNSTDVTEPEFHLQECILNIHSSTQRGIPKDVSPTIISNRGLLFGHKAIRKDELLLIPTHLCSHRKMSVIHR